jgi:hypothetical protein
MEPVTPLNIDQQIKLLELKTAQAPTRKPWLIPVSIGLIILIVLVILAVTAMANVKTKAPPTSTLKWKTYTSTQHQFTFKYPPDWQVQDAANTNPPYILTLTLTSPDYQIQQKMKGDVQVITKLTGSRLEFTIDPTFYYSTFNQFHQGESRRDTTIIDIAGLQALHFPPDKLAKVSATTSTSFLRTPKNTTRPHLYQVNLTYPAKQSERYVPLFDQILSTFYFPTEK